MVLPGAVVSSMSVPSFAHLPLTGPKTIAARLPADPAKRRELMDLTFAGIDLPQLPEYYLPYADEALAAAAKAQPLAKLAQRFPEARAAIAALAGTAGIAEQDLGYLPLIGRDADLAVIVDRRNGNVLGTLPFDPW